MYEGQDETGRYDINQGGFGGNLVPEGNIMAEGEEMGDHFQTNQNQIATNDVPGQIKDDNSFHMDKYIEKFHEENLFLLYQDIFLWQIKYFYYQPLLNFFSKDLIL